jgi:threonine/homoserine/homoserine lactone efflux protein
MLAPLPTKQRKQKSIVVPVPLFMRVEAANAKQVLLFVSVNLFLVVIIKTRSVHSSPQSIWFFRVSVSLFGFVGVFIYCLFIILHFSSRRHYRQSQILRAQRNAFEVP